MFLKKLIQKVFMMTLFFWNSVALTNDLISNFKIPINQIFEEKFFNYDNNMSYSVISKSKTLKFFKINLIDDIPLDKFLQSFVKKNISHPLIKIRATKQNHFFLNDDKNITTITYNFYIGGIPICEYELKVHLLSQNEKSPIIIGHFPKINSSYMPNLDLWPNYNITYKNIGEFLIRKDFYDPKFKLIEKKPCLYVKDQEVYPAWKMIVYIFNLPYFVIANDSEIFVFNKNYFGVEGTAKIYETGPIDNNLTTFTLKNLIGDGTLNSTYFITENTKGDRASSSSHVFEYSPSDYRFAETSIYTNVQRQYEFFESLGYQFNTTAGKIKLVAHAIIEGSTNNALYVPAYGSSPPTIYVGDGDGSILKNLGLDRDVVSHEFGHHVIYDNIKSVDGESLILHEGLADYFLYAATNNACLGESICPLGSPIQCEIEGHCLRSGDNNYVLNINTKLDPHFKSQFLSGMLWSLRKQINDPTVVDKIVFKAISFLLSQSGYRDLIIGMLMADSELYSSKYCPEILSVAKDRGLEKYIEDIVCGNAIPTLTGLSSQQTTSENDNTSSNSKKKKYIFCSIATEQQYFNKNNVFILLVIILLPFIFVLKYLFVKEE